MQANKKAQKSSAVDLFADLINAEKTQDKLRGLISAAIYNALQRKGWSIKKAATILGTSKRRLKAVRDMETDIRLDELALWSSVLGFRVTIIIGE